MNETAPAPRASTLLRFGALDLDRAAYRASLSGAPLALSRSEIDLLAVLVENSHRVLSREELSHTLGLARGRSVDVLLSSLRRTFGGDFVRTVRNRGWILERTAFEG